MRHKVDKSLQISSSSSSSFESQQFTFETQQFGSSLPTSENTIFHYSFEARPVCWVIQGNKGER